ncbi:MAG: hypothetical protein ACR2FG_06400 [Marmoricola sp.]
MKRSLTFAAAALLLATGCGQTHADSGAKTHPSTSGTPAVDSVGKCAETDPVIKQAPVVGRADLDGDGSSEDVRRTVLDANDCPDYLFARVGDRLVGAPLGQTSAPPDGLGTVKVPGRDSELLVVRATHPRGGFETHLFGYADGMLTEVRDGNGNPVVPFVATDTRGGYVSATCGDNAIVVRQAVTHTPPGVAFAWDIRETTYRLDGTTATRAGRHEIKDNVLPQALTKSYPALVHRQMFKTGCAG